MRPFLSVVAATAVTSTVILAGCSGGEARPKPSESTKSETVPSYLAVPEPPGELVDVDGHAMHLYCLGAGGRTVVLEAGLANWSLDMRMLQEDLAATTRVCSYDRAGYGWSEPGPEPRTGERIVDELDALLNAAKVPGPYVLAGHSFGGLTTLLFAEAHPEDVAGVVLIDSSHPGYDKAIAQVPEIVAAQEADLADLKGMAARAEAGKIGPVDVLPLAPKPLRLDLKYQWAALFARPHSLRTTIGELDAWKETAGQVGGAGSLADIPLIVLAAGIGVAEAEPGLALTPEDADRVDAIWRGLQEDHVKRSTRARLVVAHNSGHGIHFDEPKVVLEAIRGLAGTQ